MARYLKERNPAIEVVGADPVGSIYSGDEVHPYLVEGVGEDFWPSTYDPSVVDRYVRVSDRDSFLTTRRLAETEGMLVGGSGGMAAHAALAVARGIDDPEAMVAVVLPDGGRAYLSKIFNDTWMASHGMLERTERPHRRRRAARQAGGGRDPAARRGRDAPAGARRDRAAARAPRLPAAGRVAHRPGTVVGSIGERGLLKHAADNPAIMGTDIVDVMEPPFPAVAAGDPVREAVELLAGDRQALLVTEDGRPTGILTRADLLEALVS